MKQEFYSSRNRQASIELINPKKANNDDILQLQTEDETLTSARDRRPPSKHFKGKAPETRKQFTTLGACSERNLRSSTGRV